MYQENFKDDLAIGKRGEKMVISALKKRGHSVIDVSDNAEFRLKDIDIIISKNG
jgi:Holliday junction resolvase-like predicted endonuclease